MFGKRKLEAEIVRLRYRVAELEERLCPCEGHDWKEIKRAFVPNGCGDGYTWITRKCRTCGKVYEECE